jgi:hypothetical protein
MTWQLSQLTYELLSPLHIGYHKIGNLQRTRYYIPARNIWGGVAERLTRSGFQATDAPKGDYEKIGDWVKTHFAFGYWFIRQGNEDFAPHYSDNELKYGRLTEAEFERRYLDSHVTTALDAATTSAEEGSLHEVEFIAAYNQSSLRTCIGGWVLMDEIARNVLGEETKWHTWLDNLQIGGERRYGFGRLRMVSIKLADESGWALNETRPHLQIKKGNPLLAHTRTEGVVARGQIEPFMGRETHRDSRLFGQVLTRAQICWIPGSVAETGMEFKITEMGVWDKTE